MRKSFCIAGVMILLGSLAQTALAVPYYLPSTGSTYGEENGWKGYKMYKDEDEGINVMLTFNVYDMQTDDIDWVGDIAFPDTDRYLYAYQLFNANNAQTDVTSLNLVDLSGNPIAQFLMHLTQAVDDPANENDVMPDNPSAEQGKWIWSPGVGFVTAGEFSTFLIFSSAYAPVAGDFRVETIPQGELPIPEPATIALLGGAFAFIASRCRKKENRQT